jgi:hypothetical protein
MQVQIRTINDGLRSRQDKVMRLLTIRFSATSIQILNSSRTEGDFAQKTTACIQRVRIVGTHDEPGNPAGLTLYRKV